MPDFELLISQLVSALYCAVVYLADMCIPCSVGDIRPHSSAFCRPMRPRRSMDSLVQRQKVWPP